MSTAALIILIVLIVMAAIVAWDFLQKRRTIRLRSRFGPEYEHVIDEYGNRSRAEKELHRRAERAEGYRIHPLTAEEQNRFSEEWRHAQARFVDDPPLAIRDADRLVDQVMRARGYPVADFDRRTEDLSVDHPRVVRNYRTAHDIALVEQEGRATTEDLRRAMVLYRDLFDELLETHPVMPERETR